jgi:hypothetical protein
MAEIIGKLLAFDGSGQVIKHYFSQLVIFEYFIFSLCSYS